MLSAERVRRVLAAAVIVALLGATNVACAMKEPEKKMTAREGRDKAVELVMSTAGQLDVTGWWPRNGVAWAQECSLGGGKIGASYGYDRWAPRGADPAGDAQRVVDYWESLGMTVRVVDQGGPVVYGEGGSVLRAEFDTNASDNSYSVGAVARCAPGDAVRLNDEDEAEREKGAVLPGDEGIVIQDDPRFTPDPNAR